jgi:hypothetical protein
MKKMILMTGILVSMVSNAQLVSKPAVLHLNGEATLDLNVIADGGSYLNQIGSCEFYIEQDGEVITFDKRKIRGHTSFIRRAELKEGFAELYVHCEGPVLLYLAAVGKENYTKAVFNNFSNDPSKPYKLEGNEFVRVLEIRK